VDEDIEELLTRNVGGEALKSIKRRIEEGFYRKFLSGMAVLDIGYRGNSDGTVPITKNAIGIELDYPGYDGITLPFPDGSQDAVFSSHCLEHIPDYVTALKDWYRVLKVGGFLITIVPHHHLFERKPEPPSHYTGDHQRFYTSRSLLQEMEEALPLAGYRVRWLKENDEGFDYSLPPRTYGAGCFEIELVLEKIAIPAYADKLFLGNDAQLSIDLYVAIVKRLLAGGGQSGERLAPIAATAPLPPFSLLLRHLKRQHPAIEFSRESVRVLLDPFVRASLYSEEYYAARYPDLKDIPDRREHFIRHGYFEGREAHPSNIIFG
jgi:predicted SAM-dependent methyltransferase